MEADAQAPKTRTGRVGQDVHSTNLESIEKENKRLMTQSDWDRFSLILFCFFILFLCLCLSVLGLHCSTQTLTSCGDRGPLSIAA